MELYGREYGFKFTVGAASELAAHCPDGDMNRLGELIRSGFLRETEGQIAFICALSHGYENARSFEIPGYTTKPITKEMLESLDFPTLGATLSEALSAFLADKSTTVDAESAKKNSADVTDISP